MNALAVTLRKVVMATATVVAGQHWGSMPALSLLSSLISVGAQQLLQPHLAPLTYPSDVLLSDSLVWPLTSAYIGTILLRPCLLASYRLALPATAATMAVATVSAVGGTAAGAVLAYPLASLWHGGLALVEVLTVAELGSHPMSRLSVGATAILGGLTGAGVCYASRTGAYHWLCLPVLVTSMTATTTAMTFLGAHDLCALCCVSAGVCAGAALRHSQRDEAEAAQHLTVAAGTNLLWGDYVEACYPICEGDVMIGRACVVAAAAAGAVIHVYRTGGSAYLPGPLVVGLSGDRASLLGAMGLAFGLPFAVTWWRT